jgi:hypothetical protein
MTTPRIHNCYQDQDPGLTPKSTRLAFKAMVDHGPGHQETQRYGVGADAEGKWDVLWLKSDWVEETIPLAWIPKGALRGKPLHLALVQAWLRGAKEAEGADSPPYGETIEAPTALLDETDLGTIEETVWAEEEDESE